MVDCLRKGKWTGSRQLGITQPIMRCSRARCAHGQMRPDRVRSACDAFGRPLTDEEFVAWLEAVECGGVGAKPGAAAASEAAAQTRAEGPASAEPVATMVLGGGECVLVCVYVCVYVYLC